MNREGWLIGPTDDALVAALKKILKDADLESLSLKQVIKQLEHGFGCTLKEKKKFIDNTLTVLINDKNRTDARGAKRQKTEETGAYKKTPSDSELTAALKIAIKGADLEALSLKQVIKQLEKKFGCPLQEKKKFIDNTLTVLINEVSSSSSESSESSESSDSDEESSKKSKKRFQPQIVRSQGVTRHVPYSVLYKGGKAVAVFGDMTKETNERLKQLGGSFNKGLENSARKNKRFPGWIFTLYNYFANKQKIEDCLV